MASLIPLSSAHPRAKIWPFLNRIGFSQKRWNKTRDLIAALMSIFGQFCQQQIKEKTDIKARKIAFLDTCTIMAVYCRDYGLPNPALRMMRVLRFFAPWHINVTVEILVLTLYGRNDLTLTGQIVKSLTEAQKGEPRIAVLAGEYYSRTGDVEGFLESFRIYQNSDFGGIEFFSEIKQKQALQAAMHTPALLQDVLGASANAYAIEAIKKQAVMDYFKGPIHPNNFWMRLYEIGVYNMFAILGHRELVCEALKDIALSPDIENIGLALHFLVCVHEHARAEALLTTALDRKEVWENPAFCKAAVAHLPQCASQDLKKRIETILATKPWKMEGWRYDKAVIQALELTARAFARDPKKEGPPPLRMKDPPYKKDGREEKPGKKAVFVGLYGQTRYEGLNLPALRSYLTSVMEPFCRKHNLELRWAVGTWGTAGERQLLSVDGFGFVTQRLPQSLIDFCTTQSIATTDAFARFFPATMARLLNAPSEGTPITREGLEKLFGPFDGADLADEKAFARVMDQAFPGADRNWANQCRMWNRIESLAHLFDAWEQEHDEAVVASLLIRVDLVMIRGNWDALFEAILSGTKGVVYLDEDEAARFVEGTGDRYFVTGRADLPRLSGLWGALDALAPEADTRYREFSRRFGSHTIAGTYLFQHGAEIKGVSRASIDFDIYRGRLNLEQLRPELTNDSLSAATPEFRQALSAFLQETRS